MIPIEKEPPDFYANLKVYERCYFCIHETNTWHIGTNQPVCANCAKTHKVAELKKAHPDYKPPKKRELN
jgi:hypothetical protein